MNIKSLIVVGVLTIVSVAAYAENETVVTSKKYVDDELSKKQPQFDGLGNDKLMLYSNTTDGATLSRDIVTTLGDSTTATSVPTRGAINAGLATKQNTLNGTAGWVVENTGTAGSVKARPVYSTTDNYKTALVEVGDLNQIVIDAVNSELTQVADGWRINDSVTLPTLRALLPNLDASIGGTSSCYRRLKQASNSWGDDGNCNATTLATLGAQDSKSGLWGAVFPYGDIVGKSVCSTVSGTTSGDIATDAQNTTMDGEFSTQTGIGESALDDTQKYCWCKMENVDGEPAVSRWVFRGSYSSASICAGVCANFCGNRVRDRSDFRAAMFNTL